MDSRSGSASPTTGMPCSQWHRAGITDAVEYQSAAAESAKLHHRERHGHDPDIGIPRDALIINLIDAIVLTAGFRAA